MADAEVVSIDGKPIYTRGVAEPELVGMLTDILELAQRGEIHGVHLVIVHDDGVARKARMGRVNYSVIGALTSLTHELLEEGFE